MRRMTISLTAQTAAILADLAASSGKTKAEVVRAAIGLEKLAQDAWARGGRVLVERRGGTYEVLPH